MEEEYIEAISYLPPTKYIESFYLDYRPWIRDKSHRYRVVFVAITYDYEKHKPINIPTSIPYMCTGFGATPKEALINFTFKMVMFKEAYGK